MLDLIDHAKLPHGAESHPDFASSVPVGYLAPTKARKVVSIIIEIFEAIIDGLDDDEED